MTPPPAADAPHLSPRPAGRPDFARIFDRAEFACLLAALFAVILVYPLRLHDPWLEALTRWWNEGGAVARWTRDQVEGYVGFYYSPLVIKGVLATFFMLLFSALRVARRLLGVPDRVAAAPSPWAWGSIVLFFAWVLLSGFWSPTPALARDAAWWAGVWGFFAYLLLRRGLSGRELRALALCLVGLGLIVVVIVLLQALPVFHPPYGRGVIFYVMNRFDIERNVFGSLIGHNTAAASFLLLTAFPALALVIGGRRWGRTIGAVHLVLAAVGIVILQSRAVWIFLPLLGIPAVWTMARRVGIRRPRPIPLILVGIFIAGVLSQAVDAPWNPLYVEGNLVGRRVRDLTPRALRSESRLRLNVIGATMLPERPLFGHGLYAFQYVYPRHQGEWFTAHPESSLNRTIHRSHMAHNEYLQIAIDHGLVGLALFLGILGEAWRRGRRLRVALPDATELFHRALGWSALAVFLHALVDFPFHVPQLALPLMLCLAGWASVRPDSPGVVPADPPADPEPVSESMAAQASFRLLPFLRLLGALLALAAVPYLFLPFMVQLQSDLRSHLGDSMLRAYDMGAGGWTPSQRAEVLRRAAEDLTTAEKLDPANHMAQLRLGETLMRLGYLHATRWTNLPPANVSARAESREAAMTAFNLAIEALTRSARGMAYHYIFYQRAQVYLYMATIEPEGAWGERRLRELELTVLYAPNFSAASYELAELLAPRAGDPAIRARVLALRRTIYRITPIEFNQYYVFPANRLFQQQRYRAAADGWEEIVAVDPENIDWLAGATKAAFYARRRDRAAEFIERIERLDPQLVYTSGVYLLQSAIDGDWAALLEFLPNWAPWIVTIEERAEKRLIEQEARRRLAIEDTASDFPRPVDVGPAAWDLLLATLRPGVIFYVFNDPAAALRAVEARLALESPPPLGFWVDAERIAAAAGDDALANRARVEIEASGPGHAVRDMD